MTSHSSEDIEVARKRKALNAVRLMCLGPHTYSLAARTFGLQAADIRTAEALLDRWRAGDGNRRTESEKVAYLLSKGWRPSNCGVSPAARRSSAVGSSGGQDAIVNFTAA